VHLVINWGGWGKQGSGGEDILGMMRVFFQMSMPNRVGLLLHELSALLGSEALLELLGWKVWCRAWYNFLYKRIVVVL